jgi:hypothetical protein
MKNAPIYDVRAYGAKGDGVANDTAAIQRTMDAVKAAGGGSVFFPKGTFRYVNPATSYYGTTMTLTNEGSNVTVFGTGDSSVIQWENPVGQGLALALPRTAVNTVCDSLVPFVCDFSAFSPAWGPPPVLKQFQPAVAGSKTITLVTYSDASFYSPGMDLRLQSGDNSPHTGHPAQHFEYNQVVSANPGNGVIALAEPLDDSYDLQDPAWPPFAMIVTVLPKNILIRDLKITHGDANAVVLMLGGVRNVVLERVSIVGKGNNSNWYNGGTEGLTIRDSVFDNMVSDLGDGGYNMTLDHNIFKNSPGRTIQAGSSLRSYRITNNTVELNSTACCDSGINITSANVPNRPGSKVVISGNRIRMPTAQYGSGVQVIGVNDVLITGNTVTGPGVSDGAQAGISVGMTNNARVTNNMVSLKGSGTTGVGINNQNGPTTGVVVEGNTFNVQKFGVNVEGAATVATIGCNMTMGGAAEISDAATGTVHQCGVTGGVTYYINGMGSATATLSSTANHQYCWRFITPVDLQIGHIVVPINTADTANTTDVGIYGPNNSLIAHTGPISMALTGGDPWPNYAWAGGGTVRIPAGRNMFCFLSTSSTFKLTAFASAPGDGGGDYGLNSDPGACAPGANGSCPANTLRPQIGALNPFYVASSYPVVMLEK